MKTVTAADDASASLHFNEFPSEKKEKTKMVQRLDFFLLCHQLLSQLPPHLPARATLYREV